MMLTIPPIVIGYGEESATALQLSGATYVTQMRTAQPNAPLPNTSSPEEQLDSITSTEGYDLLAEIARDIRIPRYEIERTAKKRDGDYFKDWGSVLAKVGFRLLEYCQRHDLQPPSEEVLRVIFARMLMREADRLSRLVDIDRWDRARTSATFVLQEWNPNHRAELAEKGRRGGQKSKTPFRYDSNLLDGLHGLSIREQAKHLGIPKSSVADLRRRHWAYKK